MAWNQGWDEIFCRHEWGKYPAVELVRFVAREFYGAVDRSKVDLLELGCGMGANLWFMAREGFSVSAIDGSKVAIDRARERCNEEGVNVDFEVGDIMALPYPDAFFDGIIDVECIYANSMADSRVVMSEVNRVLKTNGAFFSITFMTGTYGDGNGIKLKGEKNTYTEIHEGAFKQGYGIIRLSSEEDIRDLYSVFDIENMDYVIRSEGNRSYEIREWLVTCRKNGEGSA